MFKIFKKKNKLLVEAENFASNIMNNKEIESSDKKLFEELKNIMVEVEEIYSYKLYKEQIMSIYIMCNNKNLEKIPFLDIKTGEGKTIVFGISALLHVLLGYSSFSLVASTNDYLSKRDMEYLKPLFLKHDLKPFFLKSENISFDSLKQLFSNTQKGIFFGTLHSFAFSALTEKHSIFRNEKLFVDIDKTSLFIDEADYQLLDLNLTPIKVNSNLTEDIDVELVKKIVLETEKYYFENKKNGFKLDPIKQSIEKTPEEFEIFVSNFFNNDELVAQNYRHWFINTIIVIEFFKEGVNYTLTENKDSYKISIIDEDTGRVKNGITLGNNLHNTIEIYNNITNEKQVVLSKNTKISSIIHISEFVNEFNIFTGASGSMADDSSELKAFYGKTTLLINRHTPSIAINEDDVFFESVSDKINYLNSIIENNGNQPILVGALNGKQAQMIYEEITNFLEKKGDTDKSVVLLLASNHEKEEEMISLAGKPNQITITTPMAGRGTDIIIDENVKNTGLYVIGFEKSLTTRSDTQLRGRCGRRGQNGKSVFFISIDDKLGSSIPLLGTLSKRYLKNGKNVSDPALSKMFTDIQNKISNENSSIKEQNKKFDDELFKQRRFFYTYINLLKNIELSDIKKTIIKWNKEIEYSLDENKLNKLLDFKRDPLGWEQLLSTILLELDSCYSTYLSDMMELLKGIQWRGRAKKDPFEEFLKESSSSFDFIFDCFKKEVLVLINSLFESQELFISKTLSEPLFNEKLIPETIEYNTKNIHKILFLLISHVQKNLGMLKKEEQEEFKKFTSSLLKTIGFNVNENIVFENFKTKDVSVFCSFENALHKMISDNPELESILTDVVDISISEEIENFSEPLTILSDNNNIKTAVFNEKFIKDVKLKVIFERLNEAIEIDTTDDFLGKNTPFVLSSPSTYFTTYRAWNVLKRLFLT
jgi:preprotein translocase subunit SecA